MNKDSIDSIGIGKLLLGIPFVICILANAPNWLQFIAGIIAAFGIVMSFILIIQDSKTKRKK